MLEKQIPAARPEALARHERATVRHGPLWSQPRAMTAAALLLIIIALAIVPGYVQKWLWMRQLEYVGVFWTLVSVRWTMFWVAFVLTFLYLWINLRLAAKNCLAFRADGRRERGAAWSAADAAVASEVDSSPELFGLAAVVLGAGVALFFAAGFYTQWDTYLRFRYGGSFGVTDPLFGVDVGFYVFHTLC